MKFWLSRERNTYYAYVLLRYREDKEEYIEINLYILEKYFWINRHKRKNLKLLFTQHIDSLPPDSYVFYYFPGGYNKEQVNERDVLYCHEIIDLYRERLR